MKAKPMKNLQAESPDFLIVAEQAASALCSVSHYFSQIERNYRIIRTGILRFDGHVSELLPIGVKQHDIKGMLSWMCEKYGAVETGKASALTLQELVEAAARRMGEMHSQCERIMSDSQKIMPARLADKSTSPLYVQAYDAMQTAYSQIAETLMHQVHDAVKSGVSEGVTDALRNGKIGNTVIAQAGANITIENKRNAKVRLPTSRTNRKRAKGCSNKEIANLFTRHAVPLIRGKDRDGNIAYEKKRGGGGGTYYVGTCSPRTIGSWLARTLPEPISGFSSQMLTKPDEIKAAAARWGDYWRNYAAAFYEWRQSHPYSKRENFRFETHKVYHHREESPTFADDGTGDD